ncbi:hypothetical protein C2S52_000927 [Perilla frutescens var. hirtella]|nr:hypothetical protein C2S52_000927 [Perilla frutescens var. hirtella]
MAEPKDLTAMFEMMKQMFEKTMGTSSSASGPTGTSVITPSAISTPTITATAEITPEGPKSKPYKPSSPPTTHADTTIDEAEAPVSSLVLNPTPLQEVSLGKEDNPIDPDIGLHTRALAEKKKSFPTRKSKRLHGQQGSVKEESEVNVVQQEKPIPAIPEVNVPEKPASSQEMVSSGIAKEIVSPSPTHSDDVKDDANFADSEPIYPPSSLMMFLLHSYGMDVFLKERGLWKSVTALSSFEPDVIAELYANVSPEMYDKSKRKFWEVYLLDLIDDVVGTVTGGLVTKWTNKISTSKLTFFYSVLHKLIVCNWLPTTNTSVLTVDQAILLFKLSTKIPFNLGDYIFYCMMKSAAKTNTTSILPFPLQEKSPYTTVDLPRFWNWEHSEVVAGDGCRRDSMTAKYLRCRIKFDDKLIDRLSNDHQLLQHRVLSGMPLEKSCKDYVDSPTRNLRLRRNNNADFALITNGNEKLGTKTRQKTEKGPFKSKNLMSERNRRKRIKDGELALRALVPKITKIDKVATLVDAADYIKELLKTIRNYHDELQELEEEDFNEVNTKAERSMLVRDCANNKGAGGSQKTPILVRQHTSKP